MRRPRTSELESGTLTSLVQGQFLVQSQVLQWCDTIYHTESTLKKEPLMARGQPRRMNPKSLGSRERREQAVWI